MVNNKKYAWTWVIKDENIFEYVEMHLNPWPEILEEHSAAGIYNYSIFQNGNQFFYCFECNDIQKAFAYLNKSDICQKWNAITQKMVKECFDFSRPEPIKFLHEVFFLK